MMNDMELLLTSIGEITRLEQEIVNDKESRTLTDIEIKIAQDAGVKMPEKIRILLVDDIQLKLKEPLRTEAEQRGVITKVTAGLTCAYGIFIRKNEELNSHLISHEIKHVFQYESLNGIDMFLTKYLKEINQYGYKNCPMEKECNEFADKWDHIKTFL